MAASINDHFRLASGSTTPVVTSLSLPKSNGSTTAGLTSAVGWDATTGVDVVIYRRQLNTTTGLYEKINGTQTVWVGVLTGTTLSNLTLRSGTEPAAGYAADGNTVVFCGATAAWADDAMNGILVQHNQDGTHKAITTTSITNAGNYNQTGGTFAVPAGAIGWNALSSGAVVQSVETVTGAMAIGTTLIPQDDTIPQITEGTEFMTLAITPKSATNILKIRVTAYLASSTAANFVAGALFQDATANALAAGDDYFDTSNAVQPLTFTYRMVAGTTSATTFRFRAGPRDASTVTFNGSAGVRRFGGVIASSIEIVEYKA